MGALRRTLWISLLLVPLLAALPKSVAAQLAGSPHPIAKRDGMWFSGALGSGVGGGGFGGLAANIALGWTVSPRVSLAVGSTDWRVPFGGSSLTMGTLDFRVQFYPESNAGFFLTGGLGMGFFLPDGSWSRADVGRGYVLGLGYDARVSENTSITTFINRTAVHTADPQGSGIQFGVGLTFH
jgi:hypothetical protein